MPTADLPKLSDLARRCSAAVALLLTAACVDSVAPTGPDDALLHVVSRIECVGSTVTRSVACAPTSGSTSVVESDTRTGTRFTAPAALHDVILGNQGGYVKLTSSNISWTGGVFSFDVTLKNLIAQAIGTTNGFSPAASGSRVFFFSGPTVTDASGGTIDFAKAGGGFYYDGLATFTGAGQPYFQYNGVLQTGDVSASKTWKLRVDPGVTTFAFSVYVSTPVKFPIGYIDGNPNVLTLNYGETSASLGGTVRSAVGNPTGGTITYSDSASGVVSVNAGGQVTAGATNGIAYVYLESGSIPNFTSTAVNVCASTPTLTSGAPVAGTIVGSDCASSFAGNNFRPEPTYRSDMYRISLTAGQQVAITMTSDGTFDPYLTLAGPQGIVEATAVNIGATATIPAGAPAQHTGVYTIEAGQSMDFTSASSLPGYVGNYTIGVTVTP